MKELNKYSTKIFEKIIEPINNIESYHKYDSGEGYIPLSVELLFETTQGKVYSLAHNSIQNGDIMSDPDMELLHDFRGKVFPLTYTNHYVPVYQTTYSFLQNEIKIDNPKLQAELVDFANDWMKNINDQQNLGV